MTSGEVYVRFAPSPTGRLHVGNLRTALINWLYTRHVGGKFLLRIDDTDTERSSSEYELGIIEDLKWIGMDWDEFTRQSSRMGRYDNALEMLKKAGRLYACYETAEELELKRKIQLGQGKPPVYDRAALDLSPEEQAALVAQGRKPHWRFKLLEEPVAWEDLGRGAVRFEAGHLSDPVLVREDGRPLYTLTSVVDDGELFITHVIRGEDHVVNTAVQVQLFEALGFPVPTFAHMPLMVGADGKGLSKRLGSLALHELRDEGVEPLALSAYLAHLGTPIAPSGGETQKGLVQNFDLSSFGRASPRYDTEELFGLNAKVVHHLPYEAVSEQIEGLGLSGVSEALWNLARENIGKIAEIEDWISICHGEIEAAEFDAADLAYIAEASELFPGDEITAETWGQWTAALKEKTGRKGKALFMPLRKALTGKDRGPDMSALLPLIDRNLIIARLG